MKKIILIAVALSTGVVTASIEQKYYNPSSDIINYIPAHVYLKTNDFGIITYEKHQEQQKIAAAATAAAVLANEVATSESSADYVNNPENIEKGGEVKQQDLLITIKELFNKLGSYFDK